MTRTLEKLLLAILLIQDQKPTCLRCNTKISQRNHSETCHECLNTFCNSRFCRAYISYCNRCDKWRCRGCIRRQCPKCRECSDCFTESMESCTILSHASIRQCLYECICISFLYQTCSISLCDSCIKTCTVCDTKGKIWHIHTNRRKAVRVAMFSDVTNHYVHVFFAIQKSVGVDAR